MYAHLRITSATMATGIDWRQTGSVPATKSDVALRRTAIAGPTKSAPLADPSLSTRPESYRARPSAASSSASRRSSIRPRTAFASHFPGDRTNHRADNARLRWNWRQPSCYPSSWRDLRRRQRSFWFAFASRKSRHFQFQPHPRPHRRRLERSIFATGVV